MFFVSIVVVMGFAIAGTVLSGDDEDGQQASDAEVVEDPAGNLEVQYLELNPQGADQIGQSTGMSESTLAEVIHAGQPGESSAPQGESIPSIDVDVDRSDFVRTSGESGDGSVEIPNEASSRDATAEQENDSFDDFVTEAEHRFSVTEIENMPSFLADWSVDDNVTVANANEDTPIDISIESGSGSLSVVQANYAEMQGTEASPIEVEHTGFNIYHVSEDAELPDEYVWSKSGGSFFNADNPSELIDDLEGVKFLMRVDTGAIGHGVSEENGAYETIFDTTIGNVQVFSNVPIVFR